MDGRKVAKDIESGLWKWASALMPLLTEALSAVFGLLRRFLLDLLGGVPHEQVPSKTGGGVERKPDTDGAGDEPLADVALPDRVPANVPRWRDRLVRDCLRRISEGLPLRERHLDQLPADVGQWLRDLRPEDADAIRHLPGDHLRQQHLLWCIGGEMIGAPFPPNKDVEADGPEPPKLGPRR